MPRKRFEEISRSLHFVDSEAEHLEDDRLWKLHPVISMFGDVFWKVFVLGQNISIDESWGIQRPPFLQNVQPQQVGQVWPEGILPLRARVLDTHPYSGFVRTRVPYSQHNGR